MGMNFIKEFDASLVDCSDAALVEPLPLDVGAVKRESLEHNSLEPHHTHSNKIECWLGQFFN